MAPRVLDLVVYDGGEGTEDTPQSEIDESLRRWGTFTLETDVVEMSDTQRSPQTGRHFADGVEIRRHWELKLLEARLLAEHVKAVRGLWENSADPEAVARVQEIDAALPELLGFVGAIEEVVAAVPNSAQAVEAQGKIIEMGIGIDLGHFDPRATN